MSYIIYAKDKNPTKHDKMLHVQWNQWDGKEYKTLDGAKRGKLVLEKKHSKKSKKFGFAYIFEVRKI